MQTVKTKMFISDVLYQQQPYWMFPACGRSFIAGFSLLCLTELFSRLSFSPWLSPSCGSVHGMLPDSSELQQHATKTAISSVRTPSPTRLSAGGALRGGYSRGMMPWSTSCSRVRRCWSLSCRTAEKQEKIKSTTIRRGEALKRGGGK